MATDTKPCPYRNRYWPSLESEIEILITHCKKMFPHLVTVRERCDDERWAWTQEHCGYQAVFVVNRELVHWTSGRWVYFNDARDVAAFAFERRDDAFEFKMRWG